VHAGQDRNLYAELRQLRTKGGRGGCWEAFGRAQETIIEVAKSTAQMIESAGAAARPDQVEAEFGLNSPPSAPRLGPTESRIRSAIRPGRARAGVRHAPQTGARVSVPRNLTPAGV
jgi:hypothetical protein